MLFFHAVLCSIILPIVSLKYLPPAYVSGRNTTTEQDDTSVDYNEFYFLLPALGNGITPYLNARGSALCKGVGLNVTDYIPHDDFDLFGHLSRVIEPVSVQNLTEKQLEGCDFIKNKNPKLICDYKEVLKSPSYWPDLYADPLFGCKFPHEEAYAPWRVFCSTITTEIVAAKKQVFKAFRNKYPDVADLVERTAADPGAAVVHIRCDNQIISGAIPQYGLIPFRLIEQHLPENVAHVFLMGVNQGGIMDLDPFSGRRAEPNSICQEAAQDLKNYLQEKRPKQILNVSFGLDLPSSANLTIREKALVDWLFMSSVPAAVGSLSTFALGALLGNPGHVVIPVNTTGAVKPTGPEIPTQDECHFVDMEFLNGEDLKDRSWPDIQNFLRTY